MYEIWTEEKDKMRNCVDDGDYQGYIYDTSDKPARNGNPMATFIIKFKDMKGRERQLTDWCMLTGEMSWKYYHAAKSADLLDEYMNNVLKIKDFQNKTVVIRVVTKDGKDEIGNTIKVSRVIDYLKNIEKPPLPVKSEPAQPIMNDDIPF